MAITISISIHEPPTPPAEIYSQGFWHAVLASILYFIGCMMLAVNMVGYFRGHYPQHFDLDDDQRTLILQTMMLFFWLAGGAGVFSAIEGWTYADALYYADVVSLTDIPCPVRGKKMLTRHTVHPHHRVWRYISYD
jgi:hypothetical protein